MKPFEDLGHAVRVTKPFRFKRYEAGKLPDPGQCVDCLIIINDRLNGDPRARLAVSNGASWDHLAWLDDRPVVQSTAVAVRPAEVDLTPLVRQAVESVLPSMVPTPMKVIESRVSVPDETLNELRESDRVAAAAYVEMAEHVNTLLRKVAELEARQGFVEHYALAKAELRRTG